MSRRKKQPGFNPRENARESIRSIMRGINSTEQVFLGNSKKHAEKIDAEFEQIDKLLDDQLKAYMVRWLKNAQAAFIGALADFQSRLNAVRLEADGKATKLMAVVDEHKWDEIKDMFPVAEIELGEYSIQVDNIAQETLLSIIEAGSAYEQRRQCVRVGLHNNWTVAAIVAKLDELDAQAIEEAAKAAEPVAAEAQEETANV